MFFFLLPVLPISFLFQLILFNKQLVNLETERWSFHRVSDPVWDLAMSFIETTCSSQYSVAGGIVAKLDKGCLEPGL